MKANYWQKGDAIDFVNATENTIPANTLVVLGTHVGVAGTDIAAGETGTILVSGVWKLAKKGAEVITAGTNVYYSSADDAVTATAAENTACGYAIAAAAAADETVLVRLPG
jgi:predicted RecA/RadA family phage recombinase